MLRQSFKYLVTLFLLTQTAVAQQNDAINWLSFQQLEDSLAIKPKKVFIDFYADWCAYCKKMDKVAYKDPAIIAKLNSEYYPVKMDAESTDTIVFGGDMYRNKQLGKSRRPTHDIPLLLASRENRPFSLPAIVILNERFEVTKRYFEYMDSKALIRAIK